MGKKYLKKRMQQKEERFQPNKKNSSKNDTYINIKSAEVDINSIVTDSENSII